MTDHRRPWGSGGEAFNNTLGPQTIHVVHHLSPETATLLHGLNSGILAAITELKETLMSAFTDLKASVEAYIAAVEAKDNDVAKQIADAVAADEAGEDVDLKALQATVEQARAKVTPPVVPPAP